MQGYNRLVDFGVSGGPKEATEELWQALCPVDGKDGGFEELLGRVLSVDEAVLKVGLDQSLDQKGGRHNELDLCKV